MEVQNTVTKPQFFEEASFFLSVLSVRVGQTPVTCPIDLKLKRPGAPTQPGLRGSGVGVKTFFHPRGVFFVWAQSPALSGGIKKALCSAGSCGRGPGGRL